MSAFLVLATLACTTIGIWLYKRQKPEEKWVTASVFAAAGVLALVAITTDHPAPATTPAASTYVAPPQAQYLPNYTYTVPTTTPVQPPAPVYPLTSFGAGTYLVGSEVAPGNYVTEGAEWCYWERMKNLEGTFGSIIANDNVKGHATVTIKPGDVAFKVNGTCTFTKR